MTPYQDYPRMMFHRSGTLTCVVLSRDEEDELGAEWRRTVWPPAGGPAVEAAPDLLTASAGPETSGAPGDNGDPGAAPDEASAFEPAPKKPARKRR
jgi:hypothetical protein